MKEKTFLIKGKANKIDQLVSKRLKMRRLLLGFTQQDLGMALNVSIQQIQKYENGSNRISSGRLFNIAEYLKVPITYFFKSQNSCHSTLDYTVAEDQTEYILNSLDNEPITKPSSAQHSIGAVNFTDYNMQLAQYFIQTDKEILGLVKAFGEIKNKNLRKKIIELVKSINISCEL